MKDFLKITRMNQEKIFLFHSKSPKIFPGSYVFISVFTHLFLIYFLSALILSVYFIDYCVFLISSR